MFLPATRAEKQKLGWKELDIILVTGDAYIDSPFIGVAVIGKLLVAAGYRVGIIAQPNVETKTDITRLGEPRLFWGISGGSIDSLVANRTASGRKRKRDDYTPGGRNTRRPDRAVLIYANLIRKYFKNTKPLVLGGIEASLRRVAHYDYWSNKVRKSILVDAKAEYLLYGMAEYSVLALADCLQEGISPNHLRGLCYLAPEVPEKEKTLLLPSFAEAAADKDVFSRMFMDFYRHNDPVTAQSLAQQQDKVMARIERSGVQGKCGPKLNPKKDPSYWLNQPGAPKKKLANEKPQGQTVDYDELVKSWAAAARK